MSESIELLKEKRKKAIERKLRAEEEIKRLTAKIEQAEMSNIKSVLKEYNISASDLPELIRKLKQGNRGALEEYETTEST